MASNPLDHKRPDFENAVRSSSPLFATLVGATIVSLTMVALALVEWPDNLELPVLFEVPGRIEVQIGRPHPVAIQVMNKTERPLRIIGASGECRENYCLTCITPLPLMIDPMATHEIQFEVRATRPGNFVIESRLFSDCPDAFELSFRIPVLTRASIQAPVPKLSQKTN